MRTAAYFLVTAIFAAFASYAFAHGHFGIPDEAIYRASVILAGSLSLGWIAAELREAVKSFL